MTMLLNTLPKMHFNDTQQNLFNDPLFEQAILKGYLMLKNVRQSCIQDVTDYMEELIRNGQWSNEYGYIGSETEFLNEKKYKYETTDDFYVKLHQIGDILYYKILPLNYFRQTMSFDGYFERSEFHEDFEDPNKRYNPRTKLVMYFS